MLEHRLRDALDRLNPSLPVEASDDAFRKITRPEGSTLEARNRAFHRLLVDGVTVEYRTAGGDARGTSLRPRLPKPRVQRLARGSIALSDWGEIGSVSSRKSVFKAGDILFGKLRPYFHKAGIAPVDGFCSTDIVVLSSRKPRRSSFVLACVSSSAFVAHTSQTATGTKMPRTSWRTMRRIRICSAHRCRGFRVSAYRFANVG